MTIPTAALLDFYLASGSDSAGRRFEDVLALDLEALESNHDFIQWIFPLRTTSSAVPWAPTLDDAAVVALRHNPIARERALAALRRMLKFYGLELVEGNGNEPLINRGPEWLERCRLWVTPFNHNYLRLTRILTSLQLLGLAPYSRALFACLSSIYKDHAARIGARTFAFWEQSQS